MMLLIITLIIRILFVHKLHKENQIVDKLKNSLTLIITHYTNLHISSQKICLLTKDDDDGQYK